MTIRDVDDIADEVLPIGGPYDPEALAAAASLTAELVRRLAHATFAGTTSLPYPSDVDTIVSRLGDAVHGMPQLLRQLADRLMEFCGRSDVYADALAGGELAEAVIDQAVTDMYEAGGCASEACDWLSRARDHTARLGIHANES